MGIISLVFRKLRVVDNQIKLFYKYQTIDIVDEITVT